MRRIVGSPINDTAFHSYDITRELSLSFPPGTKKVTSTVLG